MNRSLRFVKGHCGWDTVTLVVGEEVPEGKEIETALKILDPPINGGIEVGFMYRPVPKGISGYERRLSASTTGAMLTFNSPANRLRSMVSPETNWLLRIRSLTWR